MQLRRVYQFANWHIFDFIVSLLDLFFFKTQHKIQKIRCLCPLLGTKPHHGKKSTRKDEEMESSRTKKWEIRKISSSSCMERGWVNVWQSRDMCMITAREKIYKEISEPSKKFSIFSRCSSVCWLRRFARLCECLRTFYSFSVSFFHILSAPSCCCCFHIHWETCDCRLCCHHAAYISLIFESDLVLSRLCVRVPSELNKSL